MTGIERGGRAPFRRLILILALAAMSAPVAGASAQDWLPPGSSIDSTLTQRPARWIESEMRGGRMSYMARLGELAFRSPLTMGRETAVKGISCDSCHTNGATNNRFFIAGMSDAPGTIDITHAEFYRLADDGIHNPRDIPALRGVRLTAPYGRDGRFADLRRFSRHVIMQEFGGAEPEAWRLDALLAYMNELAPAANRQKPEGPGLDAYRRHCAQCHAGPVDFANAQRWDIGTGGFFEAPPLRGLAETAPYLHDGSAPTPKAAILRHGAHIAGAPVSAAAIDATLVFLKRFGAVDRLYDPETLDGETARLKGFVGLVRQSLLDEDMARADAVADMTAMEMGRIHGRFSEQAVAARAAIADWARRLKRAIARAADGDFPGGRAALRELTRAIAADLPVLRGEIALSRFAATAPH